MTTCITSIIYEVLIIFALVASLWWLSARLTYTLLKDLYDEQNRLPRALEEVRCDISGCYILGPVALIATFIYGTVILVMRPIHATRKLFRELKTVWRETLREDKLQKGWDDENNR